MAKGGEEEELYHAIPLRNRGFRTWSHRRRRRGSTSIRRSTVRDAVDDTTTNAVNTAVGTPTRHHGGRVFRRNGRRKVRFAPRNEYYSSIIPGDFTLPEWQALWTTEAEYEEAKEDYTNTVVAMQHEDVDAADVFLEAYELPPDHKLRSLCIRGCEKYFDFELRFRIGTMIRAQVLKFHAETRNPQALRLFSQALTAECADLAYWHGKLNELHCWGTTLHRYQVLQQAILRNLVVSECSTCEKVKGQLSTETMAGVEVILNENGTRGSRVLSVFDCT